MGTVLKIKGPSPNSPKITNSPITTFSKISHITLATAEGVKPFESNRELENNQDKIQPLDDHVDTTFTNNLRSDVSKVVDENGEPLVVYHGSDAQFNAFITTSYGENEAFFSSDEE